MKEFCPVCSEPVVGEGQKYCARCGWRLSVFPRCKHCETAMGPLDDYCIGCGTQLRKNPSVRATNWDVMGTGEGYCAHWPRYAVGKRKVTRRPKLS